jgi:hypothetical protein
VKRKNNTEIELAKTRIDVMQVCVLTFKHLKILRLLIPIYPTAWKIFFASIYILHDPNNHDLCARGQWTNNTFFAFSALLKGLAPILTILYSF